jgi:hypothetical protein
MPFLREHILILQLQIRCRPRTIGSGVARGKPTPGHSCSGQQQEAEMEVLRCGVRSHLGG